MSKKIRDYILNTIDGESDGNYIRVKGGKKVGSFTYPPDKNTSFLTLCLDDITHMSSSYRYKNFDDTSHITMSYTDIMSGIRTKLNNYDEVNVSTDYYSGDEFVITGSNISYKIIPPVLLDSNLNQISEYEDTVHTLKDNGDGTYEYTKYPSRDMLLNGINSLVNYIDATVYVGTGTDDSVSLYRSSPYRSSKTDAWNYYHDSSVGSYFNLSGTTANSFNDLTTVTEPGKGGATTYSWKIYRYYLNFDTSGITDTVESATFKVYVTSGGGSQRLAKHDDDTLSSSDSFSAYFDVIGTPIPYSNSINFSGTGYKDIILNSTGLSDMQGEDTFHVAMITSADFNDTPTGDTGVIVRESGYTGTDYDPYIEYELIVPRLKIISGNIKILSGQVIIK